MKIRLSELRKIVSEEVGRLVYLRSAGFGGAAGIGGRARGSMEIPPTNLGNEEKEEDGKEQEEWSQLAPRVAKDKGR